MDKSKARVSFEEHLIKFGFDKSEADHFIDKCVYKEYSAGERIVSLGRPIDKLVFIVEGDSHYEHTKPDQKDSFIKISFLSRPPFNIIGSYGYVLKQEKYMYSVLVKTPAYGYELTVEDCASFGKNVGFGSKWFFNSFIGRSHVSISNKIATLLEADSIDTIMEGSARLNSLLLERKKTTKAFLLILLIIGLYIVYFRVDENLIHTTPEMQIIMMAALLLIFAAISAFILKINDRALSNHGVTLKNTKKSIVEALIFATPFIIVCSLAKYILTITPDTIYYGQSVITLPYSYFILFDMSVYCALCYIQEFITRGVLQTILERVLPAVDLGMWSAIVFANFLFLLLHLHFSFLFGVSAFIFGLFWGYLYTRTRNLIGVSLHHAIISAFPLYFLDVEKVLKTGSIMVS